MKKLFSLLFGIILLISLIPLVEGGSATSACGGSCPAECAAHGVSCTSSACDATCSGTKVTCQTLSGECSSCSSCYCPSGYSSISCALVYYNRDYSGRLWPVYKATCEITSSCASSPSCSGSVVSSSGCTYTCPSTKYSCTWTDCTCSVIGCNPLNNGQKCNGCTYYSVAGTPETCNNIDDNCNGMGDEPYSTYYWDYDGDSYGTDSRRACSAEHPWDAIRGGDCQDSNAAIKPGATEVCDGLDNNCINGVDEGCITYYNDSDGDGYGNPAVTKKAFSAPAGYLTNNQDCNDANSAIKPGATEVCDGEDNNCNGQKDEGFTFPEGILLNCSFEDTLNCLDKSPKYNTGVSFVPGKYGNGILVGAGGVLAYPASTTCGPFQKDYGKISFWIKPNWNGDDQSGYKTLLHIGETIKMGEDWSVRHFHRNEFRILKGSGYPELHNNYNYLGFEIWDNNGTRHEVSADISGWNQNEWHYVLVIWDLSPLDGLPFANLLIDYQLADAVLTNVQGPTINVTDIMNKIFLGVENNNTGYTHYAEGVIDELTILGNRPDKWQLEICDGKDNDYSGIIDDNIEADTCEKTCSYISGAGWMASESKCCGDDNLPFYEGRPYQAIEGNGVQDPETCSDGKDNDCDGAVDMSDPDCDIIPPKIESLDNFPSSPVMHQAASVITVASDNYDIKYLRIFFGGTLMKECPEVDSCPYVLQAEDYEAGKTVYYRSEAIDYAGNFNLSKIQNFSIRGNSSLSCDINTLRTTGKICTAGEYCGPPGVFVNSLDGGSAILNGPGRYNELTPFPGDARCCTSGQCTSQYVTPKCESYPVNGIQFDPEIAVCNGITVQAETELLELRCCTGDLMTNGGGAEINVYWSRQNSGYFKLKEAAEGDNLFCVASVNNGAKEVSFEIRKGDIIEYDSTEFVNGFAKMQKIADTTGTYVCTATMGEGETKQTASAEVKVTEAGKDPTKLPVFGIIPFMVVSLLIGLYYWKKTLGKVIFSGAPKTWRFLSE